MKILKAGTYYLEANGFNSSALNPIESTSDVTS